MGPNRAAIDGTLYFMKDDGSWEELYTIRENDFARFEIIEPEKKGVLSWLKSTWSCLLSTIRSLRK